MIFETLSTKHLDMLFNFELENRAWFESVISPRDDYFYSYSGVKMHIFDSIINMKLGTHFSGVLILNNQIVARANLKDICLKRRYGSVGYRVAENNTGKGYASYCLRKLIKIAVDSYSINELEALVLDNNPASKAVLQKLGFEVESHKANFIYHQGRQLGCTTFKTTVESAVK
ncbi:MAG: GNAT family protein [Cognaticolwellia sp.]